MPTSPATPPTSRAAIGVTQGRVIGYVGSTGRSTGPHLHYEILADGAQIDPLAANSSLVQRLKGGARNAARAIRTTWTGAQASVIEPFTALASSALGSDQ